jgi:hypothetical protein
MEGFRQNDGEADMFIPIPAQGANLTVARGRFTNVLPSP